MTRRRVISSIACSIFVSIGGSAAAADSGSQGELPEVTLAQVLELAAQRSPRLRAARIEPAVARAQLVQASLRPNPVLGFLYRRLVEGDVPQNRFRADLSTPVDISGRRRVAQEEAALGVRTAEIRLDSAVLAMTTEVRSQFLKLLYLQRLVEVRTESVALAEQLVSATRRRQELGDLSRAAAEFAQLTLEQARGDLLQAQGELNQAKAAMDLLVGGELPEAFAAAGDLTAPRAGCDRDALLAVMQREHPNVQLLRLAVEQAGVGVRLSRAQRIPLMDLGVRLEVRSPGARLVDGVFVMPLPLFDRRQGDIAAATHQVELARQRQAEGELGAVQQVDALCGEIATAERVLAHMEERVLPLADNRRVQFATEFTLGEIRLEETLIVARQVLEIREQTLEAVYRHAAARLALSAAVGDVSP